MDPMKRLCLSAAVKKTLVRFVSTRSTSSLLMVSSSFEGGVGLAAGSVRLCLVALCAPLPCTKEGTASNVTASSRTMELDSLLLILRSSSHAVGDGFVTALG